MSSGSTSDFFSQTSSRQVSEVTIYPTQIHANDLFLSVTRTWCSLLMIARATAEAVLLHLLIVDWKFLSEDQEQEESQSVRKLLNTNLI